MSNILSKTGILPGTVVQASYVSQSIDAFTGIVPYTLSLNGNFNLIGNLDTVALGNNNGTLTGSLSATSASYSEGVLSNNVPTSSTPILKPNIIIAGNGTIPTDENTFSIYSSFFTGKTLNNEVWVTLLQRAPYPDTNPNFGTTCVTVQGLTGNTLTFSVSSGNASTNLIFDFIIMVQR